MINIKYFKDNYTITPLGINVDISNAALECVLSKLKFSFDKEYTLVMRSNEIRFAHSITEGLGKIEIEFQDDLLNNWYVVDKKDKLIIYSRGP